MDPVEAINARIMALEQQKANVLASLRPLEIALGELYALRSAITGEDIPEPGSQPLPQPTHRQLMPSQAASQPSEKEAPPVVLSPKSKTPVPSSVQELRMRIQGGRN